MVLNAIRYAMAFNAVMFGAALAGLLLSRSEKVALGIIGLCLGAAFGSFLNLFVYRLRAGVPVNGPPSHCPRCKSSILSRHNVPVFGWLWLRGRCASCGESISWHYPAVELAAGCLGVVVALGIAGALV